MEKRTENMKFMHLSDLHIGKRVNGFSMLEDQKFILNQILMLAEKEKVDGVWIAGDVYDKTVPSAEAVQLFDDFLTRLVKKGLPCFIISGNHDSAERIAFGARLMDHCGVYLSPVFDGKITPVELEDEYGKLRVYLLPFLKPAHVRQVYPETKVESYQDAVQAVVEKIYGRTFAEQGEEKEVQQEEATRIQEKEEEIRPQEAEKVWDSECRNVILAHQFIIGASRCESEEVSVGGLDQISADIFQDFDYVALGHLHTPQTLGGPGLSRELPSRSIPCGETGSAGAGNIRYCGTPLKYSFSEAKGEKSVTIVELKEKGNTSWYTIPLKPRRDLREIRGTYMELTALENYKDTNVEDYLHITLTDEEDVPDAMGKLRSIYPNIMKLDYDNLRTRMSQTIEAEEAVEEKSPIELFEELYQLQNNQEMSQEQRAFAEEMIEKIWEQKL